MPGVGLGCRWRLLRFNFQLFTLLHTMQDVLILTGKYLGAKPIKTVGANGFTVRSMYMEITTNPQYPNTPEIQLTGDKVTLVDNLKIGQQIQVRFNVEGQAYVNQKTGQKDVMTRLKAYKIDVVQVTSAAVVGRPMEPVAQAQAQARPVATAVPAIPGVGLPGEFQSSGQDDDVLPF